MDPGFLFTVGVACGVLGTACFVWLLLMCDPDACAYFSVRLDRLGVQRTRRAAQDSVNVVSSESGQVEQPRGGSGSLPRGTLALLLAVVLVSGCASVGGGVGDVHAALSVRRSASDREATAQPPTSPRTEELPVCGFEAPYLPDPCRMEVTPGEWLRVSNPRPQPTKRHGWLWWVLVSLVTL